MDLAGKRVLVVGLGKSGVAVSRLLQARGAQVIANDVRTEDALGAVTGPLRAAGVELRCGGHDARDFADVDQIVVSPGVPPLAPLADAELRGVPIASEVEVASWFIRSRVIGITGTNGKSTVTALVGEMCARTAVPTFVGGNLGTPLIDVVGSAAAAPGGVVVAELSSFQLERVERLRVNVAALLNVSSDHLDRYPSYSAYAEAKARIFAGQQREDAAVVPAGDAECHGLASRSAATLHEFGGREGGVRVRDQDLLDEVSGLQVPLSSLRLRGQHNLSNACAAALIARLAGVESSHIAAALTAFEGLPHRAQFVAELAGVAYIDDSKATNVGAAVAALDGLSTGEGRVVLIAGGKDKGGDYAPIGERLQRCGRALLLIGEAAPLMERALSGGEYPVERADSLQQAVARARELAEAGDTVLLAPACASFDMFRSYGHRGEVFQRAVQQLRQGSA